MLIRVEKLVYGGSGLARTDDGVIFVPGTIPGELVDTEIVNRKNDYSHARVTGIIEPSEDRREPLCPNFETVGCCDWSHITYERQLLLKEEILLESLARLAKIEWRNKIPCVYGPELEYRLRASFHVSKQVLGFMRAGTKDLVPINSCSALMSELNQFVADASDLMSDPCFDGTEAINVIASPENGKVTAAFLRGLESARWNELDPTTTVSGIEFRLNPNSFFQPNRFLLEHITSLILEEVGLPNLTLDLFCGSGFFSLPLAKYSSRLVGIDRRSVRIARWNARHNEIKNVEFIKASAGEFLSKSDLQPDFVLLDPPRTGAGTKVIMRLARLRPDRIVYVSCNPTTFAPEARLLLDSGYRLVSIKFIDQFPNTHHIETVALFQRA